VITTLLRVTALAGLVLATVGCSESQDPELDVQATIDASVEATVAASRSAPTATSSITTEDVQSIVATATVDLRPSADPTPAARTGSLTAEAVQTIVAESIGFSEKEAGSTTLTHIYEAPSGRWSIRHPGDWIAYEVNVAYSERIQLTGLLEGSAGSASAAVVVERVADGGLLPLAESTDAVILVNLGHLDDFRLISRSTQTIGGTIAEEIIFSHKAPLIGPAIGLMIVVRATSDIYTIQGVTLASSFDDVEGEIRDILYSFRILE
jgi:hypothetical protein